MLYFEVILFLSHISSPLLLLPPTKNLLLSLHPIFKTVLVVLSLMKYTLNISLSSSPPLGQIEGKEKKEEEVEEEAALET